MAASVVVLTLGACADASVKPSSSPKEGLVELLSCQAVGDALVDVELTAASGDATLANALASPSPVQGGWTQDGVFAGRFASATEAVTLTTAEFSLEMDIASPFEEGASANSPPAVVRIAKINDDRDTFVLVSSLSDPYSATFNGGFRSVELVRGDVVIHGEAGFAGHHGSDIAQVVTLEGPAEGSGWTVRLNELRFTDEDLVVPLAGCD